MGGDVATVVDWDGMPYMMLHILRTLCTQISYLEIGKTRQKSPEDISPSLLRTLSDRSTPKGLVTKASISRFRVHLHFTWRYPRPFAVSLEIGLLF